MPKGPRITDEVKRLIAEVNDKHPEFVAKEVKEEVQARLRRLRHQAKPDWPGISTVQIELKKMRNEREKGPLPIDGPWSIGKLAEYAIPSEAVSQILKIQATKAEYEPMTIREAKWIGRLYTLTDEIIELAVWAAIYADRDRTCDIADIDKDTSDLDSIVQSGLVTGIEYFSWLFGKTWVPDSYKKHVAEEQTLKYERIWGLEMDRPNLSLNGWLIYANTLQHLIMHDKSHKESLKDVREFFVIAIRQIARDEGQVPMGEQEKIYLDLVESIREGEISENLYNEIKEIIDPSSRQEMKELLKKVQDKNVLKNEGGEHARSHSQEG